MAATTAGGTGTATTTQTTGAAPTATAGPALGFTSSHEEVVLDDLEVTGALPAWLAGSLLRTGPARFEVGERTVGHWFDGLAQLHRFSFAEGRVGYASRFLRSRAFTAPSATGASPTASSRRTRAARPSAASPRSSRRPRHDRQRRGERRRAGRALARPDRDADAGRVRPAAPWQTLGVAERPPGDHTTAHPHDDGGELWGHAVRYGARSSYLVYAQRPGQRRVVAKLPVRRPAYHHSFALTPTRAVLAEAPFTVEPLRLALGRRPFAESFEWRPQDGARLLAVDRRTGAPRGHVGRRPVLLLPPRQRLRGRRRPRRRPPGLRRRRASSGRWRWAGCATASRPRSPSCAATACDRARRGPRSRSSAAGRFELPVIDYGAVNGRPYRRVWGVGAPDDGGWFDRIVATDVTTGEQRTWREPGTYPGEPVLAKRPGATEEDDGVLLSVLLEPRRGASALLVLDARTLEELARARVPHHIPFGFHGAFTTAA